MRFHLDAKSWGRVCFAVALAVGMAVVQPASAQAPQPSTAKGPEQKFLADAQTALKKGDIGLAIIHLKNAVRAAPGNGAVRARLGMVLYQAGDAVSAERELRQARKGGAADALVLPALFQVMLSRGENQTLLDEFPASSASAGSATAPDILAARALAFQFLGRPAEAADAMDRALKLRRDARGLLIRARIAMQQGDGRAATGFVDEAIRMAPDKPEAMIFKVRLLLTSRQTAAALDLANQLVAKFPSNLQVQFSRIDVYLDLKQDAKAKAQVDAVLAKTPNVFLGVYYRALLMARAGDTKGAWDLAQTLPQNSMDAMPNTAIMIAQMAQKAGRISSADSILSRTVARNPGLLAARIQLAALRLDQNSANSALTLLEPIKDSADPAVMELLARTYSDLYRKEDAAVMREKLNAARKKAPPPPQAANPAPAIQDLARTASGQSTDPVVVMPYVRALTQTGRYKEALAAVDALGSDPKQRAVALSYRGSILLLQGDTQGAQAAFNQAVTLEPRNKTVLSARAGYLMSLRRYPEARRDLNAILALDAKDEPSLLRLAEISAREGDDRNTRQILARAIANGPQNPAPRGVLIRYLIARKDFKAALAAANDMIRAQPGNGDGLVFQGQILSALGQKKEAVASFRRLESLAPSAPEPKIYLSRALFETGDRAGAARMMDAAVKLRPADTNIKAAQVNLQLASGNRDAALASARNFQDTNPGSAADLLLADTLLQANRVDEASKVLSQSLATRPSTEVFSQLFRMAVRANDNKRAEELASKWLAGHRNDIAARLEYAGFLLKVERNAQAIAQYEIILKQEPRNSLAMNNLGWLLQTSDPNRAISLLTRAVQLSPDSPAVADSLGWIKIQQKKDIAGGLQQLDRAHRLLPDDGEITYHLAVALDANSNRAAARTLLKTLLASDAKFKSRPEAVRLSASWN